MAGIFQTILQTYSDHRRKNPKMSEYEYFKQTPYLHSSGYIQDMYRRSINRQQRQILYGYLERFEVNDEEYAGYYSIYEQISRDLGYIEEEEEYISIPKSLIYDYVREMVEDDGSDWYRDHFYKHCLGGKEGSNGQ